MDASPEENAPPDWRTNLDQRTATHVQFAQHYAANFNHGAPGHLDLLTIAQLAQLLDRKAPTS